MPWFVYVYISNVGIDFVLHTRECSLQHRKSWSWIDDCESLIDFSEKKNAIATFIQYNFYWLKWCSSMGTRLSVSIWLNRSMFCCKKVCRIFAHVPHSYRYVQCRSGQCPVDNTILGGVAIFVSLTIISTTVSEEEKRKEKEKKTLSSNGTEWEGNNNNKHYWNCLHVCRIVFTGTNYKRNSYR